MKVYISKSNLANPNILINLRKELTDQGIEIIEWEGGDYNSFIEGVFEQTKAVFVISHADCFLDGHDKVNLGKGILREAYNGLKADNIIFTVTDKGIHLVSDIKSYAPSETQTAGSWKTRAGYAKIRTDLNININRVKYYIENVAKESDKEDPGFHTMESFEDETPDI